jgi:hypothetical protein
MALETFVDASLAFWTFATTLRGRDSELAGRTCLIPHKNHKDIKLRTYFGLSFPTRFAGDFC